MGDMLNTAVTGLLSFQRALSTTSHNIANVNTDGYSRQRVDIDTNIPTVLGGTFVGSGAHIETIMRAYDQFNTVAVRESNSDFYRLDKFTELTGQIDNLLADPVGGISPILQEFFDSVQDVADDPTSSSARYQLINTADSLASRFNAFDTRLEQMTTSTAKEIRSTVDEINQLVASIRDINIKLEEYNSGGDLTQQSSDLLDTRDALLDELSTKITIQVINEQDNNLTILVGNGQTMLNGTQAFSLSAQPDNGDPTQDIIVYNGILTVTDISAQLSGGELGGLLDYRSTVLNPARNMLGRVAIGLAESFNAQHREGMDLEDNLGGDFFSIRSPDSIPYSSNTGASTVTTMITDLSQLTIDDYTLSYDGANWNILSTSGSSATITPPTDTFEGLTINIAGVAVAGDQFTIKPTLGGAKSIGVVVDDPNLIAAAVPIRTLSSLQNIGDIEISPGIITDVADPALLQAATITFNTPPNTFDVVVGGVTVAAGVAYSDNMQYSLNGWEVTLSGSNPQPGDTMTIEANFGGTGDNRNALDLGILQTTGLFDNGIANYQESYSSFVGKVGSMMHVAMIDRDSQQALLTQAEDRKSRLAGVNLDEEAADLIKYQQAYEASARVITTVQTMFDTLINATR